MQSRNGNQTRHYCSFEDLDNRISSNSSDGSDFMPFSAHISAMPFLKNFPGNTVAEVGAGGGVVKLPEYEIAVHCETTENLGWKHSSSCVCYALGSHGFVFDRTLSARRQTFKYKLFRQFSGGRLFSTASSGHRQNTLRDSACVVPPHYDGRVQLTLEDPTSLLTLINSVKSNPSSPGRSPAKSMTPDNKKYLAAGPVLRISFADKLFFSEITAKFSTNVELKKEIKMNLCSLACLLTSSNYGTYREFGNFQKYGSTLQMTLNVHDDLKGI